MVRFKNGIVEGGEETLPWEVEIELAFFMVSLVVSVCEGQSLELALFYGDMDRSQPVVIYVIDIDTSSNEG